MPILERNKEWIVSWLRVRKYSLERSLYLLQRVTGIGIAIFVFVHLLYTGWRAGGLGDILLGVLVTYHAINGLRLLLTENGFFLGKPGRAVYPYRKGVLFGSQRYLTIIMLILFIIALLIWSYVALFMVEVVA